MTSIDESSGRWWRRIIPAGSAPYLAGAALLAVGAFVALVYSVNWKFGVALVGFSVVLVANLYSLQLAILPVFFAVPFDRLGKLGPESVITWAKLLIAVLILAWVVHLLVKKERRPLRVLLHSPVFLFAVLVLFFSFFSIINARDFDVFLGQNTRRVSGFMLFVLIATIVDSKELVRKIFYVWLLAYFFVGLTVVYEIATAQSILKTVWGEQDTALEYTLESESFRVGGPGGDPDFLAISTIFPLLVGVGLLFERISRGAKGMITIVVLLLLACLLATGSRGGLGALLIGLAVFWLFVRLRHKYLYAAGVGVVLIVVIMLLSLAGTASSERYTGQAGGKSLLFRVGWTKMALMMIEDHPFVGIGTGNFVVEYSRYSPMIPEVPRKPHWTHNSLLQSWAENGIFGFCAYIGLYLTAMLSMLGVVRTARDPDLRRLAVLMLATLAGYLFFAGTSNVLENENYWIVFALTVVISFMAREEGGSRSTVPAPRLPAP